MGKLQGLVLICILFLVLPIGLLHGDSDIEKAKKKLEKLEKELTPEDFLDSMDDDEYEAVEAYLKAGMPVSTRDKRGLTALHHAADSGQVRIVSLLLKSGAEVNAKTEDGDTPILLASQFGHDEAINVLLRAGADANLANERGETPLMKAATVGYVQTVRLLIQSKSNINAADEQGNTPLICASSLNRKSMMSLKIPEQNFVSIIQDLVKAGADVNAKRKYHGESALIEAADQGHTEIVKALLAAGADVNAKTKVDELTPLINAARHGHTEIAKLLIAAGADVNAKDRIGRNAAAFAKDYPEIMELVGSNDATIQKASAKTTKDTKPAKVNVSGEEQQAARNLLEARGIEFNEDMFMHYVKDGDIDVVDMFLTAGMKPDVKDDRDGTTTALIYAGMMKRNEVALALIKAGADVNAMDMNGSTTLIWIANHCDQSKLVGALIKNGANVNAKAAGGATPLMMADISNCTENAALLKKAGAKSWK
jgi:ankyrin repeat protein